MNILPKESLDKLLIVAGGGKKEQRCFRSIMSDVWEVFKTVAIHNTAGVSAIKMYVVDDQYKIFTKVFAFPADLTVLDILNMFGLEGCSVVSQGVELRAETPITFLRNECYYADGFVHLVVFKR